MVEPWVGGIDILLSKHRVINNRVLSLCVKCLCEVKFIDEVGLPKHPLYECCIVIIDVGLLKRVRITLIYKQ